MRRTPLLALALGPLLILAAGSTAEAVLRARVGEAVQARATCALPGAAVTADLLGAALPGALTGRLDGIAVHAAGGTVAGAVVDVVATVRDLDLGTGAAGSAEVTVTVPVAALVDRLAGATAERVGRARTEDGRLVLVTAAGGREVEVVVALHTRDGALVAVPESVRTGPFEVPAAALGGRWGDLVAERAVALPPLPAGFVLAGAGVGEDGVELRLGARDLPAGGTGAGRRCGAAA